MNLAERREALQNAAIEKLIASPPASLSKDDLRKFARKAVAAGWDLVVEDIKRELNQPKGK